ncbi:hypothetical protein [uncultured Stenotrophomonas sp.]|uniref:hypothetical protein n=1 Tax=uncultured Stenotrophomonas sp. TaxID=165438 RepID=UPI0028EF23F9|nr:hypothetical protein [uncultured Stenotrophomonas sp.]
MRLRTHIQVDVIDAHPNARLQRCQSEITGNTPVNTGVFASTVRAAEQWNKIMINASCRACEFICLLHIASHCSAVDAREVVKSDEQNCARDHSRLSMCRRTRSVAMKKQIRFDADGDARRAQASFFQ